jgi:hypothetical protein
MTVLPIVFDMDAAADYLGITPNTLRAYRFKRYPPEHPHAFPEPIQRVGNGKVPLWTREQLDAWTTLRSRTHGT